MGISSIISRVVPVALAAATGGTSAAIATAYGSEQQKRAEARQKRLNNQAINQYNQEMNMAFQDPNFFSTVPLPQSRPANLGQQANQGFGSTFGTFLSDATRNILNPLAGVFSSVKPFLTQQSSRQPALPTQSTSGGQESSTSGTQEAFMGGFGNILGQAGRFLRTPAGQIGTGVVGGIGASLLGGQQPSTRITRKMKAQYRAVLNLNMGNYEMAADMIGVSTDFFIMVLLKRFRNDGPVVTKAALRKTKTTVRRLKSMCDMYDSLRPTATRRRAPMKRATTTLIKN